MSTLIPNAALRNPTPLFSIIIAVYNDWTQLDKCLQSLAQQKKAPLFEVIIVDDGSSTPRQDIEQWDKYYSVTVITQAHSGISAARNRGIKSARGMLLVFVDADCKLEPTCLAALALAADAAPRQNSFQLRLTGNSSRLVGRAETLRLATLQDQLLEPNGCIRYLDTAGTAIRRAGVDVERGLFDVRARRGEDTILLAELMQKGELPLFVAGAVVQHDISLSLAQYFVKGVRAAYVAENAVDILSLKGVAIRVSHRKRLQMLVAMWRLSQQYSTGKSAWFITVTRQTFSRISSCLYWITKAIPSHLLQSSSRTAWHDA
jgi:glycosyltransferase involved in cell wall biosynthesis